MGKKNTADVAYVLSDRTGYEENMVIVYARTAAEARKTRRLEDVEYINTLAERRPALDRYAPNGPSIEVLAKEHGWRFGPCCGDHCGHERMPNCRVSIREMHFDNERELVACCAEHLAQGQVTYDKQQAAFAANIESLGAATRDLAASGGL